MSRLYIAYRPTIPPIPITYEPETEALLNTIGVTNDSTIYMGSTAYELLGSELWTYLDQCVVAIKVALGLGLGSVTLPTRMKFWYPRLLDTATAHKYNLVDPTTFVGTYAGTFTHDGAGDDPNGVNAYFDTDCAFNTFSQNDMGFMLWIKDNNNGVYADIGCVQGGVGELLLYPRRNSTELWARVGGTTESIDTIAATSVGFVGLSRSSGTEYKSYKNGALVDTNANVSFNPLNSLKIKEYTTSFGNDSTHIFYTPNRHTHFIGMNSFTLQEYQDVYNAINTLETALNR